MDKQRYSREFKSSNYELFILGLSLLSLINIILWFIVNDPGVRRILILVEVLISMILIGDFLLRLYTADSKSEYFFKQSGWLDLIGSLPVPGLRLLRLSRIIRAWQLLRAEGLRPMLTLITGSRAGSSLLAVAFLIVLLLEFGSIAVLRAEQGAPEANIVTAVDAIWWVIVTVATVGYGDKYPVTDIGRIIGVFVILTGVGLFGVLTGYLANSFLGSGNRDKAEQPAQGEAATAVQLVETIQALQDRQARIATEINAKLEALEALVQAERRGDDV